jgi:hypothetical protein
MLNKFFLQFLLLVMENPMYLDLNDLEEKKIEQRFGFLSNRILSFLPRIVDGIDSF